MLVDGTAVWRTAATPHGPATLHLRPVPGGTVRATAWGPGAEWLIDGVPELLGAGDDWSGFTPVHALLAQVWRGSPGLRLPRARLVFEMLAAAVLEQKVTGVEARRAWRWLLTRHGTPAPGPAPAGLRVAPTASAWRRIPSWDWHRAGVDGNRAGTIIRAAAVAPRLEATVGWGRGGPALAAVLCGLPGVGAWTAAEVAQRAHGDPDAVSVGDYHLAGQVGWALRGRPLDDAGMLAELAPYAGQRYRAIRLLEVSGVRAPRFGARMPIADHRSR
jgi:3-methyladenine DNA glycosylase/8-oxoguanine DNA glycosylase